MSASGAVWNDCWTTILAHTNIILVHIPVTASSWPLSYSLHPTPLNHDYIPPLLKLFIGSHCACLPTPESTVPSPPPHPIPYLASLFSGPCLDSFCLECSPSRVLTGRTLLIKEIALFQHPLRGCSQITSGLDLPSVSLLLFPSVSVAPSLNLKFKSWSFLCLFLFSFIICLSQFMLNERTGKS